MKSVKLFLLTLLIVCFINLNNAEAQYKFTSPATVSVELTLVQRIIFKKVSDADKDALIKNKVKSIRFKNSRGDVEYLYDAKGQITDFSITDKEGNAAFNKYEYDANGQLKMFYFGSTNNNITDGVTYNYKNDDNGKIISAWTEPNVMFSPAKEYKINYDNKDFPGTPTSIFYYKGEKAPEGMSAIEAPLYQSTITSDEQGRIKSVLDKDGKMMIKVDYTDTGYDIDYLVDFVTHYTIKDDRITNIADDFVATEFSYNKNGLIDSFTITSKEDSQTKQFVMEYGYY